MAVLFYHTDPSLGRMLEIACEEIGLEVDVFTVTKRSPIESYFQDLSDIEAVFIGFKLPGSGNVISDGLIKAFLKAGFGFKKKPLVAVSLHHNNRLKQAGCTHETDGDGLEFRLVLQQLMLERSFSKQMSHAG